VSQGLVILRFEIETSTVYEGERCENDSGMPLSIEMTSKSRMASPCILVLDKCGSSE